MPKNKTKARSRQTLNPVTPLRAHPPETVSAQHHDQPQQPLNEGGVNASNEEAGGRLASQLAAGKERQPEKRNCRADCLTCPDLIKLPNCTSFTTGRCYDIINIEPERVHCKLVNYIYLLTCKKCGVQYVGESTIRVNMRMNIHRKSKSGCERCIDHYKNVCVGASFSVQIIEKLDGDGRKNRKIDPDLTKYRLQREDYWIKTLRTVYPYGLNDRTKEMCKEKPTGCLFPPLSRYGPRRIQPEQRRVKPPKELPNLINFREYIDSFSPSEQGNICRKTLESLKRKNIKNLAEQASQNLNSCSDQEMRKLEVIVDMFLTKTYKHETKKTKKGPDTILPIFFDNKGLEYLQLGSILRMEEVIKTLPRELQEKDPPSIVYSLGKTVRSKIFNYKQTVTAIDCKDLETYGTGIHQCDCQNNQEFVDEHHGHVLTGNLQLIKNSKLRKLLKKGPNFREPRSINFNKCKTEISVGLDKYIMTMQERFKKVKTEDFKKWKELILLKISKKISSLTNKIKTRKTNPILKQIEVIQYLETLQNKYVIVPIDKAANNVAVICKKYYVEVILKEIGIIGGGNPTYSISQRSKEDIIEENVTYSKRQNLDVKEKERELPMMHWLPKLHKTPTKARFIIASKQCSTKQLSKAVSSVFRLAYQQIENFHKNAKFLRNYNKFWVLQNIDPVMKNITIINRKKRAKSISTYDFSTLYTTITHHTLIERLNKVIDKIYNGGDKNCVRVSKSGNAYWGKMANNAIGFTVSSLKQAVQHLIENCFFTVGNCVLRQDIGIPMGIDPAPFWANLYLYTYEEEYMSNLISSDKTKARHFHSTNRFIDDLCTLNDGNLFGKVFQEIYPPELELKIEHTGMHGTFLNLDITVKDGLFIYKLFDKRDAFPFSIVRMPHKDSNIPSTIFYSALVGEFLRIGRSTLLFEDFIPRGREIISRMITQGAKIQKVKLALKRIMLRHQETFSKYQHTNDQILQSVT